MHLVNPKEKEIAGDVKHFGHSESLKCRKNVLDNCGRYCLFCRGGFMQDGGGRTVELFGYEAEPLREDHEFILYRGHPKDIKAPSVLLLATVSLRPALETLKTLVSDEKVH
jgi:hypothetical protein